MITTVYVKMDAHDELLLSEGVCQQLGIINYHPQVRLREKRWQKASKEEFKTEERGGEIGFGDGAIVPTVRVKLIQSVRVLPFHTAQVPVRVEGDNASMGPLLVVKPKDLKSMKDVQLQPVIPTKKASMLVLKPIAMFSLHRERVCGRQHAIRWYRLVN